MTAKLPLPQLDASHLGAHRLFVLTDDLLFDACGVRIAFTSRNGGVSEGPYASLNCGNHVGDQEEAVMQNRAIVLKALGEGAAAASEGEGLPLAGEDVAAMCEDEAIQLVVPSQVHGIEIVQIEAESDVSALAAQAAEGADGILVRIDHVGALLNFADCLPLIVVAPSGDFVVAHAGWRGAVAHIAAKAAMLLAGQIEDGLEDFNKASCSKDSSDTSYSPDAHTTQDPTEFNAYIGPFIHAECFEVSEEIAQQFAEEFGEQVLADMRHVDLFEAVKIDLMRAGLQPERIVEAGICTQCHPDEYFSYRATGGTCGRHSAVAVKL